MTRKMTVANMACRSAQASTGSLRFGHYHCQRRQEQVLLDSGCREFRQGNTSFYSRRRLPSSHLGLIKFSQIELAAFSPRPSRLMRSRKVWMGGVTLTCSNCSAPRNTPSSYGIQRLTLPFPLVSVRSRAETILLRSDIT